METHNFIVTNTLIYVIKVFFQCTPAGQLAWIILNCFKIGAVMFIVFWLKQNYYYPKKVLTCQTYLFLRPLTPDIKHKKKSESVF